MEAGVNRHVWGPDNAVYIGGIGSTGNWRHDRKLWYGLQRIKYNEKPTFEMLAVRAKTNGLEIEMTQPLAAGIGTNALKYTVKQWWYKPTAEYGGPKMDLENLGIESIRISEDRKKIFLELDGMKEGHVVYLKLPNDWTNDENQNLWSTEAWYTLNNIPKNTPGYTDTTDYDSLNKLSGAEKADGWKLLFDGKTTDGWRNFRKQTIGSSWIVRKGSLMLNSIKKEDGGWQAADGGDIITDKSYENFELNLEWRISPCGNSGIIYNVTENDKYDYVWQTGPEMQVLDNTCHADAKIEKHRAGDLYDMISCNEGTLAFSSDFPEVGSGQVRLHRLVFVKQLGCVD
jgi:cytochrome c